MRGPDGKEVLVPRGSRVIGQYGSDTAPGQNRILLTWDRLVLPDGRQVKLAAPAADRTGAPGIRGRVHDDVIGRFLSSIFRSALDIVTLRAINNSSRDSVVLAVPNSLQGAGQGLLPTQQYQRRITVPAGTKLSVFVTQDIDLSQPLATLGR
jgi:type IV secretion system protein VirB10